MFTTIFEVLFACLAIRIFWKIVLAAKKTESSFTPKYFFVIDQNPIQRYLLATATFLSMYK